MLFVELKAERGALRPEQALRLAQLGAIAPTYVWRPSQWNEILHVLSESA